jgi:hypothetical protein
LRAESHNVVFPIPASPETTSPAGRVADAVNNVDTAAASDSRGTGIGRCSVTRYPRPGAFDCHLKLDARASVDPRERSEFADLLRKNAFRLRRPEHWLVGSLDGQRAALVLRRPMAGFPEISFSSSFIVERKFTYRQRHQPQLIAKFGGNSCGRKELIFTMISAGG